MRAVTIDSDLATLFTFTPRKPPITPIQEVVCERRERLARLSDTGCLGDGGPPILVPLHG